MQGRIKINLLLLLIATLASCAKEKEKEIELSIIGKWDSVRSREKRIHGIQDEDYLAEAFFQFEIKSDGSGRMEAENGVVDVIAWTLYDENENIILHKRVEEEGEVSYDRIGYYHVIVESEDYHEWVYTTYSSNINDSIRYHDRWVLNKVN